MFEVALAFEQKLMRIAKRNFTKPQLIPGAKLGSDGKVDREYAGVRISFGFPPGETS